MISEQQAHDIAELEVNRYFDHYLTEVFPKQVDRLFAAHNTDATAHPTLVPTHVESCKWGKLFTKARLLIAGVCLAGGAVTWETVRKLLAAL